MPTPEQPKPPALCMYMYAVIIARTRFEMMKSCFMVDCSDLNRLDGWAPYDAISHACDVDKKFQSIFNDYDDGMLWFNGPYPN
jgi:hypothetical protein